MKKYYRSLKGLVEEHIQRFKKETFPDHQRRLNAESFKTTTDLHVANVTSIK